MPNTGFANIPRRVLRVATTICLLLVVAALVLNRLREEEARYAAMTLCLVGALTAGITALVYVPRARDFENLIGTEAPLVHWRYRANEWQQFVGENLARDVAVNWAIWALIAGIAVITGLILTAIFGDPLFLVIIAVLLVVLLIPAMGVPRFRRWRMLRNSMEAIIGRNAVYVGGRFQSWNALGARLDRVTIDERATPNLVEIQFTYPALTGLQEEAVRIPIPAGELATARRVRQELVRQLAT